MMYTLRRDDPKHETDDMVDWLRGDLEDVLNDFFYLRDAMGANRLEIVWERPPEDQT